SRMFNLIASGVVLLDSEGRVQFANVAAQKLLDDCVCPSFLNLLREDGAQTRQRSSAVIRAAIEAGLDGQEYTEFLSLARVDNQRDLLITVCALDRASPVSSGPVAALFISGGIQNEPAPVKALESLFGLTPSEGRVAWAFAQGLRPEQIASNFHISLTTVA